jgi:hypothetical protein
MRPISRARRPQDSSFSHEEYSSAARVVVKTLNTVLLSLGVFRSAVSALFSCLAALLGA